MTDKELEYAKLNVYELLLIKAVHNLHKRINFLGLNSDLQTGLISEGDFHEEMNTNPDKYVIDTTKLCSDYQFQHITKLMELIDLPLDTAEVEEMFGVHFKRN